MLYSELSKAVLSFTLENNTIILQVFALLIIFLFLLPFVQICSLNMPSNWLCSSFRLMQAFSETFTSCVVN